MLPARPLLLCTVKGASVREHATYSHRPQNAVLLNTAFQCISGACKHVELTGESSGFQCLILVHEFKVMCLQCYSVVKKHINVPSCYIELAITFVIATPYCSYYETPTKIYCLLLNSILPCNHIPGFSAEQIFHAIQNVLKKCLKI